MCRQWEGKILELVSLLILTGRRGQAEPFCLSYVISAIIAGHEQPLVEPQVGQAKQLPARRMMSPQFEQDGASD